MSMALQQQNQSAQQQEANHENQLINQSLYDEQIREESAGPNDQEEIKGDESPSFDSIIERHSNIPSDSGFGGLEKRRIS